MGQMRFVVPCNSQIPNGGVECAYMCGIEGIPWRGRCLSQSGPEDSTELVLQRAVNDSGNFCIPWNVTGHGELTLATASLMERETPYNLPVELARGTLNRLRNQAADWKMSGLVVPEDLEDTMASTCHLFGQAVSAASDVEAAKWAAKVLQQTLDATDLLVNAYIRQTLEVRCADSGFLPTMLGGVLSPQPLSPAAKEKLPQAWNAATVPISWRSIERSSGKHNWATTDQHLQWCRAQGWRILGGPLLTLDRLNLPDWLYLWEEDFEQLQAYVIQFIHAAVERYKQNVHVWYCCARMNVGGALSLTDEQRLRLVVGSIDEIHRSDPNVPVLVSFDQPWAEYLASNASDLSPLHFADSLIRADLGVAGIGLELNFGYKPLGTMLRDPIEMNRQLDRWSLLGLPLVLFLTLPSSSEKSAAGERKVRITGDDASHPFEAEQQSTLLNKWMPLFLAKPSVHGVFWNQLRDADPCELAHGGLFDEEDDPKPVLDTLIDIRRQLVK